MNDDAGDYNDGNRAFLQAFMARGQLSLVEGKKILAAIFTIQERRKVKLDDVTETDFDSYTAAAAEALSPLDYEIRSTQDQLSKERIYAIVNSISDPLTQMATIRTNEEMLYVKRLLDAMFETCNTKRREVMAVTGMQALEKKVLKGSNRTDEGENAATVDKGLTGQEAEVVLQKLQDEKWLERSNQGFYRLSPKALIELRSWLVDAYNDSDDPDEWQRIKFCEACKDIVTIGQRCADLECNVRLHDICEAAFWNSRPNKQCPKCETAWDGKQYVGQKAVTATDEYLRGKRRSGAGSAKRSRPVENDEELEGSSNRRSRREPSQEEEDDDDADANTDED